MEEQVFTTWISVANRLPNENEFVLCECRANMIMTLKLKDGCWCGYDYERFSKGFVTHWMPLPKNSDSKVKTYLVDVLEETTSASTAEDGT